jgi:hypothetical protein
VVKFLFFEAVVEVAREAREAEGAIRAMGGEKRRKVWDGREVGVEEGCISGAEEGMVPSTVSFSSKEVGFLVGMRKVGDMDRGVRDAMGGDVFQI